MIVSSLRLSNFRSFQKKDRIETFVLKDGVNFIVGENSVGKSSFLRGLGILANQISPNYLDYFKNQIDNELLIEAELKLSEDEIHSFVRHISGNSASLLNLDTLNRVANGFGNSFTLTYSSKLKSTFSLRNPFIKFLSNQAIITKQPTTITSTVTSGATFSDFLRNYISSKSKLNFIDYLESTLNTSAFTYSLALQEDPIKYFTNLLKEKMKILSEIRKRPSGTNQRLLESLDGGQLADVLLTLKNGSKKERKKFELIKEEFNKLFPNLKLEVMGGGNNPPVIVIDKISIDYEVPIENVGAGIGEMTILLTHLIASKKLIFGLDLPEIQFHPHAQRILLRVLEENSENNQILVITHSPVFLTPEKIENISIIKEQSDGASVKHLPVDYFINEAKVKIERFLQTSNRDFFFSRATLIVEGPTETGALPIFSQAMGKDFDTLGVSVVCTGKYFALFTKLLQGFDIPYIVMNDKDALMYIEDRIKINNQSVRTSPVFANLSKLGFLNKEELQLISDCQDQIINITVSNKNLDSYPQALFEKLQEIAQKYNVKILSSDFEGVLKLNGFQQFIDEASSISDSKVIQGRFAAEKIIEQSANIPEEFTDIINSVARISSQANKK